jgi:hypothetical protein
MFKCPTTRTTRQIEHHAEKNTDKPKTHQFGASNHSRSYGRSLCSPLIPPQERIPGSLRRRSFFELRRRSFVAILWIYYARFSPFEDRFSAALRYSYRQRAVGMERWGFVITIKRRLAMAPTLSLLSFATGRL